MIKIIITTIYYIKKCIKEMDTNILNQFFYKVKVKDKIVLNYFCEYSLCTIWYKVWCRVTLCQNLL